MATLAAGTLKSTTYENALLEAAMLMQGIERNTSRNPEGKNNVNIVFNTDAGTATINATLPIEQTVDANGAVSLKASEYLT